MPKPEICIMFTGIIEKVGVVKEVTESGKNRIFWILSSLAEELKPDQSISHNGVCLTVEEVIPPLHRVTAVEETLNKTTLGNWTPGTSINLERALQPNGRLDGHFVQGHVDATATCTDITSKEGSTEYTFLIDNPFQGLIIEKGSITVNGISLTTFNTSDNNFTVAIVPYTSEYTNMKMLTTGSKVNIEFDMIGKYLEKIILKQKNQK